MIKLVVPGTPPLFRPRTLALGNEKPLQGDCLTDFNSMLQISEATKHEGLEGNVSQHEPNIGHSDFNNCCNAGSYSNELPLNPVL